MTSSAFVFCYVRLKLPLTVDLDQPESIIGALNSEIPDIKDELFAKKSISCGSTSSLSTFLFGCCPVCRFDLLGEALSSF